MSMISRGALAAALFAVLPTMTVAQSPMSATAKPPALAASKAPMQAPAADMQAVLDAQAKLGPKPIETLTPAQARLQPSPADGVMALMKAKGMSTAPDPSVVTKDLAYGADPFQKARIYRPAALTRGTPAPVIVYYHGGGWVIADLKTYDATPRFLAKQLNAIVVSVEYRHAPEHKFPSQHDDANMAYAWVLKNAAAWGGDAKDVAVAGESAGGNLAVNVAIHARDTGLTAPKHILAVYPIANSDKMLPSRKDSASAKPLNAAMLDWFSYYWSKSPVDAVDPRINLVKADLKGLAPVTIVNAQIDPLRSDGETLAGAIRAAGGQVEQKTFPGVTHEFFGMGKVVKGAYDAEAWSVARLKAAL